MKLNGLHNIEKEMPLEYNIESLLYLELLSIPSELGLMESRPWTNSEQDKAILKKIDFKKKEMLLLILEEIDEWKNGNRNNDYNYTSKYVYNIFGSKTSQDVDIMVQVHELGTIYENEINMKLLNYFFSKKFPNKTINTNLCIIENGIIVEVAKGTPDECNNSVYDTFSNHVQEHDCIVKEMIIRNADWKILRTYRVLCSFISRHHTLRADIKSVLKLNLIDKIELLKKVDFSDHSIFFTKNLSIVDIYKAIAFQLAQTIGLMQDIELYSKENVKIHFPEFIPFMDREEETDGTILNRYVEQLSIMVNKMYPELLSYNEKNYIDELNIK